MKDVSFRDFILEQLGQDPSIFCRPMFDACGLYLGKKFFGIIHKGSLYFKTNPETATEYIKNEMKPFAPSKKQILKNYYEVPPEIIENRDELREWMYRAGKL